jgi:hypothetical protein
MVILHNNNNLIFYKMPRSLAKNMEVDEADDIYIYIYIFVTACSNIYEIFVDTNMNLKVCERFSGSVNLTINTIAADTLSCIDTYKEK